MPKQRQRRKLKETAMNDSQKHRCRQFLIAPPPTVVSAVLQRVRADSVEAVVAVLKRQPHPWDVTPLLLGNCQKHPDFQPTLRSAAEQSALKAAYDALADETKWVLANYHTTESITAEQIGRETDARATFIFDACAAICNLYGSGHKPILRIAKNTLYRYPNISATHEPEDLLQVALEKFLVNFYNIKPLSYSGWLIRTMKTYAQDTARVEGRSPIASTDPPESDVLTTIDRQLPPHSRAIIREALDALKTTLHASFAALKTQTYRSRFKKVALLLLYEFDDEASQAALAEILGCSPQSVIDWRKAYLCELPPMFTVLTEIW